MTQLAGQAAVFRRQEEPAALSRPRDLVGWLFSAQLFVLIFLQKLVLPAGGLPLSLPLVTLYAPADRRRF